MWATNRSGMPENLPEHVKKAIAAKLVKEVINKRSPEEEERLRVAAVEQEKAARAASDDYKASVLGALDGCVAQLEAKAKALPAVQRRAREVGPSLFRATLVWDVFSLFPSALESACILHASASFVFAFCVASEATLARVQQAKHTTWASVASAPPAFRASVPVDCAGVALWLNVWAWWRHPGLRRSAFFSVEIRRHH